MSYKIQGMITITTIEHNQNILGFFILGEQKIKKAQFDIDTSYA